MLRKTSSLMLCLIILLSFLLLFSSQWILSTFGSVTTEEIIFNMLVPQVGASSSIVKDFIMKVIPLCLLFSTVLYFIIVKDKNVIIELNIRIKNLNAKKVIFPFSNIIKIILITIIFAFSINYSFNRLGLYDYIENQKNTSLLIEEEYVEPKETSISFENGKRNLIYIFLESMEASYTSIDNGGTQPYNLIEGLTKLSNENISFSNTDKLGGGLSVPGTTWTVAGLVSQTSGLPLKLSIDGNTYGKYNTFLPGAYTLGDILNENGYNQEIIMGSDSSYAGRNHYFTSHGNYKIFDVNTAIENSKMTSDEKVWWGFEDKNLFEWAKEELTLLAHEDAPFNFTILTADTHFEDGYLSNECNIKYDDQYSNVISCSSDMVYEFVKWVQAQDFYENTTIVISGDHLTMDYDFFAEIDSSYVRTIYNVFINSAVNTDNINNRIFTSMDLFPTTLASMGAKIEGDILGIGTNLFSDKQTLAEIYGIEKLREELTKNSQFYNKKILY